MIDIEVPVEELTREELIDLVLSLCDLANDLDNDNMLLRLRLDILSGNPRGEVIH